MNHVGEHDLVLYYYGESEQPSAIATHLERCDACRAGYEELERTLALVDRFDRASLPDPEPSYGRRVWLDLSKKLADDDREEVRRSSAPSLPTAAALAAALAIALLTGLLIGRGSVDPPSPRLAAPLERGMLLRIAVDDHLARSERLLLELVNANAGQPDLDRQRRRAARLARANRVFRRGAAGAGETVVADVLDELERTLLDIAHASGDSAREELEDLRRRIERRGILMKVRVIGREGHRGMPAEVGARSAEDAV